MFTSSGNKRIREIGFRTISRHIATDIWGDTTLPFKTRSMLNLGMLTAMSQHHELAVHVKGALRNVSPAPWMPTTRP